MALLLKTSVEGLAQQLVQPAARRPYHLRKIGFLHAIYPEPVPKDVPARWRTVLCYQNRFLLLIDEFHAARPKRFAVHVSSKKALHGGRRRYATRTSLGPLAIHPLGDYAIERDRHSLTCRQQVANGRFLLALTRDPAAIARVLNGWAVEIRSEGRTYHLLHSNQTRRLRPLGPIQTDAQFALVEGPQGAADLARLPILDATLHVLQASQVLFGENRKLTAEVPVDLLFQAEAR